MKEFKLDNEPKIEAGFKTPDGYFDGFAERLTLAPEAPEPKVVSIFIRRKNWFLAVAATLVISILIPVAALYQSQPDALDTNSIENYLANRSAISNDDLADLLDDADIQKLNVDLNVDDKAVEDLLSSNANLEEYIIN